MPTRYIIAHASRSGNGAAAQTLINAAQQPLPIAQRFIILVPDHPTQEIQLARAVWELTHTQSTPILFVTLVTNPANAYRARRRLATLAALARDRRNSVETQLITGQWLKAVHALWVPGDVVLCPAELTFTHWGKRQAVAEALITRYRIPIYLLSGFYPNLDQPQAPHWSRAVVFDVVAAVLLVVFLLFQIELQQIDPLWLRQVLLGGSVLLEYGALALWHAYMFEDTSHD